MKFRLQLNFMEECSKKTEKKIIVIEFRALCDYQLYKTNPLAHNM